MTDQTHTDQQPQPEQRIAGLTETQYKERNAVHGGRLKILSAVVPDGHGEREVDVIVRPPTREEYDKYTQDMLKIRSRPELLSTAGVNMVRVCLIAPSVDEFNAVHEKFPALADAFETELLKLAGAAAEVRQKSFR